MPRFSVIIPVYNKEKQLSKTIESVIKQRFEDFEQMANFGESGGSQSLILLQSHPALHQQIAQ